MSDVPYYHRRIPEEYFEGKGWRGWLIRVLNRVRFWLQRRVEKLVMVQIARDVSLDDDAVAALKERFDHEDVDGERQRRQRTLAALGLLATEGNRYTIGRKNSPEPETAQAKTDSNFARLMHPSRYTHGRGYIEMSTVVGDGVPEVDLSSDS